MPKQRSKKSKRKTPRRSASGGGGSQRYTHALPDRNALLEYLREAGEPQAIDALVDAFGVKTTRVRVRLEKRLGHMIRAGLILKNRHGDYCLVEKLDLVFGTVRGRPEGHGFVMPDDGGERIFLSARDMRPLIHGDRVAAKVEGRDRRDRPYGRVVEIVERGTQEIAGQFVRERGIGLVIPDNPKVDHRILIPKGESGGAKPGQMVVAKILDYPNKWEPPTGSIVQVLGDPAQRGIATDIAIHAHGIPTRWPSAVRKEAAGFGSTVPSAAKKKRVDLRSVDLVTIDGADARDFDDAVYCEPAAHGWRLLVAIADVAHYVEIDSPLDNEAAKRGTSVYFPDRVVPMLPESLSNGLCSLNPKVDRLCMVCEMQVGLAGKVSSAKFYEGVMRSRARLTYSQVNDFLTGRKKSGIPKAVQPAVRHLHDLYRAFASNRRRRGAVELDLPQTKIVVDDTGAAVDIVATERNDAHRLIEECMIAANVQAAKFIRRHRIPGLFRVHGRPDPEKFAELRNYLVSLGLKVAHPEHVKPRDFANIGQQVNGRPDKAAILMAMLRSLPQAQYTPENIGHFGLALDAYAHFTSPIRRYPDLLVHRAIRHILRGGKPKQFAYDLGRTERLGAATSTQERRAEEATREVEALLKCQYMEDKIGRQYEGVITGVTNFGVFVQLPELTVDGLLHISNLKSDYYHFDASTMALVGERSGRRYTLGDALDVTVQRVDLESRRIDFALADSDERARRSGRRRGR